MKSFKLTLPHVLKILIYLLLIILPFIFYVQDIIAGEISFWYDPARDFMQALTSLHHPTLIGPTSGIPGVFYGPYWIWLISIGVFVTKDPRFTAILIGAIPYLIIVPLLLLGFWKVFKYWTIVILWTLFLLKYAGVYATNMWNPHIAPVLFLGYILLILYTDFTKLKISDLFKVSIIGFLLGLIINFHISFGIGVTVGSYIWLIGYLLLLNKKLFKKNEFIKLITSEFLILAFFSCGLIVAFLPFFVFEARHGFNQIHATIHTLTAKGSVVTVTGLTDKEIFTGFMSRGVVFLGMTVPMFTFMLVVAFVAIGVAAYKKKLTVTPQEIKLASFLITVSISILIIYLTSKNPVWPYHFIGVEIIFILLIGLIINKFKFLQIIIGLLAVMLLFQQRQMIQNNLTNDPLKNGSLITKMYTVKKVYNDSDRKNFEVFAYSPSIYIYDYAYLFNWLGNKQVSYKPEDVPQHANPIYLILPPENQNKLRDFIEYRTPSKEYKTTKTFKIPDGTTVLRREKISKK